MKKVFSILLIAVMLLSFAACGGEPEETGSVVDPAATAADPSAETPELPAASELNIDGEFRILVSGNSARDDFEGNSEGTAVQIAIHRRNAVLAEKYGVEIVNDNISKFGSITGSGTGFSTIYNDYMSGEGAYDAASIGAYDIATLSYSGYLHDLNDTPYLNLSKSYWDQKANQDMTIGGKMYYTTGDIAFNDNVCTMAILFNKDMVDEYALDDPYELVRDGDWTLENFARLGKAVSEDINQDGVFDEKDKYGILTWNDAWMGMLAAAGEKICTVNDNGEIELSLYNERVVNLFDRYRELAYDQSHCFSYQYDANTGTVPSTSAWDANRDAMFNESRVLFYMQTMGAVERYRDSETNFGILPYPKMDAEQEEYGHSISAYHVQFICVPEMAKDYERSGIVLEELAYQGLQLITPAYYEQSLVGRYVRDEESVDMLDIVFATRVYDLGSYYKVGSYETKIKAQHRDRTPISSMYETYRTSAEQMIKIINGSMQSIQ